MAEILVASQDAAVTVGDVPHVLVKGVTLADARHPMVTGYPDLWEPLTVHYDMPADAETAPKRGPARSKAAAGEDGGGQ